MLFAIPATFAITIMRGRARRNSLLTILLIRMVPGMIYLLPYFVFYSRVDLLDTHIGLIIIYLIFCVPLIIWTLTPVWGAVPLELRESGMIDGASLWQILYLIELPLFASASSHPHRRLHFRLERIPVCPGHHAQKDGDPACYHHALHGLRRLRMGQDFGGGSHHHAARCRVWIFDSALYDHGIDSRSSQRLIESFNR